MFAAHFVGIAVIEANAAVAGTAWAIVVSATLPRTVFAYADRADLARAAVIVVAAFRAVVVAWGAAAVPIRDRHRVDAFTVRANLTGAAVVRRAAIAFRDAVIIAASLPGTTAFRTDEFRIADLAFAAVEVVATGIGWDALSIAAFCAHIAGAEQASTARAGVARAGVGRASTVRVVATGAGADAVAETATLVGVACRKVPACEVVAVWDGAVVRRGGRALRRFTTGASPRRVAGAIATLLAGPTIAFTNGVVVADTMFAGLAIAVVLA